jgi:hypothetical protein
MVQMQAWGREILTVQGKQGKGTTEDAEGTEERRWSGNSGKKRVGNHERDEIHEKG